MPGSTRADRLVTTGGAEWSADTLFDGGRMSANSTVREVAGTTADTLYLSGRTATGRRERFAYRIPVPGAGLYTLRLHFAEIYWGVDGGEPGGVGSRVFDVDAEGQTILDDYDITADVGAATASVKEFSVLVADDDVLDVGFFASVDQPFVVALEVSREVASTTGAAPGVLPFALSPPFPNPASGHASLQIDLPETARVAVSLYDALGRRVSTSSTTLASGDGQALALDLQGLAPGVYAFHVEVEMGGARTASVGSVTVAR